MSAQLEKFVLVALDRAGTFVFDVAFENFPQKINTSSRANWEPQDVTIGVKPLLYSNREPLRITIDDLWLDKTETNESVRSEIAALQALQVERVNEGTPPTLLAIWGESIELVVLEEINVEEQFFSPTGDPMRARVQLTLIEVQEQKESVTVTIREDDFDSGSGIGDF